ncbi:hypothetical protein CSB11_00850 [Candidatus Campbellbacteria bacterium]|nr:MAG: hypothetical protein CSB11_00850 [Candidatus Campbellbacteria bacterium]
MKKYLKEFYFFTLKNAQASIFGAFLLSVIILTNYVDIPHIAKYDFIFISAILFQIFLLGTKAESFKEVKVILIFHIVATIMEIFKTSDQIASWAYPELDKTVFTLFTVPLFTGFLYSAVGSYISRIIRIFDIQFINYPKRIYVILISFAIYINFFTHHFFFDFRYIILTIIFILFYKTTLKFKVYKKIRKMNFLLAGFLTAFFIWIAENIGSYTKIWLYPHQIENWQMVSLNKITSWFLLLIISFMLVSLVYKNRFGKNK